MRGAVAPGLFAPPGGLLDHMFACDRGGGRGEIGPSVSEPFSSPRVENQPVPHAWVESGYRRDGRPGDASRGATRPPRASLDRRIGSARS